MDYDRLYFVMHFAEDKERVDAIRSMTPLDDQDRYDHTIDFLKENGLLRDHTVLVHCRYGMTPRVVKLIKKAKASVVVRPEKRFYNGKKSVCPVKELHPKVVIGYGTDVPKFRYGMRRGYSIVSEIYYAMDIYGLSFSQSFYLATGSRTMNSTPYVLNSSSPTPTIKLAMLTV